MAKLKAPLMSLGASGAVGETLVFFPWKGLNVVREYVVPANPQTAGQVTQRGYVGDAVAKIHVAQADATDPLGEADKTAYSAWANLFKTPRTWFNQAVKNYVETLVASKVPVIFAKGSCTDPDHTDALLKIFIYEGTGSQLAAATFFYGTSPTALINSIAGVVSAGDYVDLTDASGIAGLTAGVKYYWQLRADAADPCEGARSGIYSFIAT